jgi:hypothetical protein
VECEGRKSMLARRQLMIHHQGPNIPAAARRCRPPCLYRGQQCYYGVRERERRKIVLNHLARQSNIHSFQLARALPADGPAGTKVVLLHTQSHPQTHAFLSNLLSAQRRESSPEVKIYSAAAAAALARSLAHRRNKKMESAV